MYDLAIKGTKWLQKVVRINAVENAYGLEVVLAGGDANDDNVVNIDDLGILANAFNTSPGDPSYDARADLSCDGQVDIDDLGILANNFNTQGDP